MTFKWYVLLVWMLTLIAGPGGSAQRLGVIGVIEGDDAAVVTNLPLHVVEKVTSSKTAADGTTITRQTVEHKWRDSQGRFRKEVSSQLQGQGFVFESAAIVDPVKNTVTILNPETKTASVFHLPAEGPYKLHQYVGLNDREHPAMPGVRVKVEELDGKTIAGVYATGIRVTRTRPPGTVGNDKTIVSVSERWISPDLKTLLASSMDDPRERQSRTITELDRGEPAAALFTVPTDYKVQETTLNVHGRPEGQADR